MTGLTGAQTRRRGANPGSRHAVAAPRPAFVQGDFGFRMHAQSVSSGPFEVSPRTRGRDIPALRAGQ